MPTDASPEPAELASPPPAAAAEAPAPVNLNAAANANLRTSAAASQEAITRTMNASVSEATDRLADLVWLAKEPRLPAPPASR